MSGGKGRGGATETIEGDRGGREGDTVTSIERGSVTGMTTVKSVEGRITHATVANLTSRATVKGVVVPPLITALDSRTAAADVIPTAVITALTTPPEDADSCLEHRPHTLIDDFIRELVSSECECCSMTMHGNSVAI